MRSWCRLTYLLRRASLAVMFVDFNGHGLPELRGKLFAERQHFASGGLNILNIMPTGR